MHTHYPSDSVSVCKECGITLRLVNTLQQHGLHTYSLVQAAYSSGTLRELDRIGIKSLTAIVEMKITQKECRGPVL